MKKTALLILLLCLCTTNPVRAYPPDNAALIYYKCMVSFSPPESPLAEQLFDKMLNAAKGQIEVDKQIQEYLKEKQQLINALQTASEIPNCDWGLDFSQGLALEMPHLVNMRKFTYIMLADAQLKKQEGRTQEAIDQCLTVLRMANHVGNDTLVSYLVGTAMTALSYDAIGRTLPEISPDEAALTELQRELELPEYHILNIKTPLLNECRVFAVEITTTSDQKIEFLKTWQDDEQYKEGISMLINADPEFLTASAEYYRRFFDKYIAALDQPYKQAITLYKELENAPKKDYEAGNKEAFATALLAPAIIKVYDLDIRRRTHQNALATAIQLYRYHAKKGSLPEKLPTSFPKDLFSGKPFEYEITDTGFTLRCRQADTADKTHEYTFKLAQ